MRAKSLKRNLLSVSRPTRSGKTNHGAETAHNTQHESRDHDRHIILHGNAILRIARLRAIADEVSYPIVADSVGWW